MVIFLSFREESSLKVTLCDCQVLDTGLAIALRSISKIEYNNQYPASCGMRVV